ncbi:MAG: hypothetical protein C0621_00880 [Desulfuromonas sp.]|nr:MAG: hypothetical protein C0621_00880 [Desulfuromonas sp.]
MLFIDVVLPVFIIIFTGFVLEKRTDLDLKALTYSSLYLFSPCLVFSALVKQPVDLTLAADLGLFMLLYTGAMLLLSFACGRLLRFDRESRSALSLTTVMMNVGNFGLPLAFFAYGEAGLDVSIMTFVLFNIPLGSLAIVIAQGSGAPLKEALLNTAKIPIFHGVILAFIIKSVDLVIPPFLLRPIELLGQAAIPVMLVILGMQLARTKLGRHGRFFTLSALLRLVAAPALALLLATLLGFEGLTHNVVVLQTSTPSAVLPLLYAMRFGSRPDLVAGAIFVSTLFSAVSLTLLLYILH